MTLQTAFKVGLIQMSAAADPDENLQKAVSMTEQAASQGAQLVCLPELFRSRYFCQKEDAALFDLAKLLRHQAQCHREMMFFRH